MAKLVIIVMMIVLDNRQIVLLVRFVILVGVLLVFKMFVKMELKSVSVRLALSLAYLGIVIIMLI